MDKYSHLIFNSDFVRIQRHLLVNHLRTSPTAMGRMLFLTRAMRIPLHQELDTKLLNLYSYDHLLKC